MDNPFMIIAKYISIGGLLLHPYLKLMLHILVCNGADCGIKGVQHILLKKIASG